MSPTAAELQALKSHTSDVTSCDFSTNYLLVTGSGDKTVRIWSWKPGLGFVEEDMSPLLGHKYGVTCVTFSPQGTMLASSSIDGTTILWSARNGNKIHKFTQVNGDPVRVCRFNNDSCTIVTGGDNGIVCIWDVVHRTLLRVMQHHEEAVHSLAFTPDSSFLLTTCNHGVIKLYYFDDVCDSTQENVGALISVDDTHDLGVLSCDFSNAIETDPLDPTCLIFLLVTSGNDQCLRLWKLRCRTAGKNHSCKAEMAQVASDAHSSSITCVRFNWSGDMLCSASMDRTVKLWDTQMNCLLSIAAHSRYVNCVGFSKNGDMICTGSNDKIVKIWDISGNIVNVDTELHKPCKVLSHFGCGDLEGITMVQEEDIVLLKGNHEDNEVILIQSLENLHSGAVNSMEFNSEGLLVTGSSDKLVRLLKPDDSYALYEELEGCSPFASHEYQINGVTFVRPGLLASCSLDGSIHLWNVDENSGRPIRTLISQQMAGVKSIKGTVDGNILLAAQDDGTSILWDLESARASPILIYPAHVDAATCCSISPDSKLAATASSTGDFKIYAFPQSGEPYNTEPIYTMDSAHDLGVLSMDFAQRPEDLPIQIPEKHACHLLATSGNDCLAKVWKIIIPKVYQEESNSSAPREQRPFWMRTADPENTNGGKIITCIEWRIFAGHGSNVTCVKFPSNRSDLICTTSVDKQARIWSVYTSQCLHVLEHDSLVTTCSFSRRGALLATGCISGEVRIWKLPKNLAFDTDPEQAMRSTSRNPMGWTSEEVVEWLKEVGDKAGDDALRRSSVKILTNDITGRKIISAPEEKLGEMLNLDKTSPSSEDILQEVLWLRFTSPRSSFILHSNPPHHLLCPITHCLMMQPVKCADGFTYEKSAIQEWFLSGGKYVSPMTNQPLLNSILTPNRELRKEIMKFLLENQNQE